MVSKLVLKHDVAFKTVFGSDDEKKSDCFMFIVVCIVG